MIFEIIHNSLAGAALTNAASPLGGIRRPKDLAYAPRVRPRNGKQGLGWGDQTVSFSFLTPTQAWRVRGGCPVWATKENGFNPSKNSTKHRHRKSSNPAKHRARGNKRRDASGPSR